MSKQYESDFDISLIKDSLIALKKIDFELAYLAFLTHEGIKPLSRWENFLEDNAFQLLKEMNLYAERITRIVKTGREVQENIFSCNPCHIDLYANKFVNKPVEKSPETQLFEGFLFGYPPCCIEKYIRKPYVANNMDEKDQKILFHWACDNCKITPFLISSYKKIFNLLKNL